MEFSHSADLPHVLISFPVGDGDGQFFEGMHAAAFKDGRYVLDNSPFYAFDVSFGDTVTATVDEGRLVFREVVSRSGHSTYRIKLPLGRGHDFFLAHWGPLEKLKCTYEGSSASREQLYAIDVPPGTSVQDVYRALEQGEQAGAWIFEEAHYFVSSEKGE